MSAIDFRLIQKLGKIPKHSVIKFFWKNHVDEGSDRDTLRKYGH
jgi:hypothetical protein